MKRDAGKVTSTADVIYGAIGVGKYVLWGLVGLALVGLIMSILSSSW